MESEKEMRECIQRLPQLLRPPVRDQSRSASASTPTTGPSTHRSRRPRLKSSNCRYDVRSSSLPRDEESAPADRGGRARSLRTDGREMENDLEEVEVDVPQEVVVAGGNRGMVVYG